MFCTECGNPVSDDASFCSVCGAQIERPIDDKSAEEIPIFDNDGLIDISNFQSPPDNSGGGNGGYTGGGNGGPTDGGGGSVAGGGAVGGDGDGNGGHAGGGNGGYVSGGVGAAPRSIVPLIAGILVGIAALAALVFFVVIPATNGAFSKYKGNGTDTSAETQGVNDWCISDGTWLYYFTRTTTPADDDGTYSIVVQVKRVRLTGGDEQALYTYTFSNCDGDEDVGLEELYLAEGRVYFIQSIWENGEQQCSLRSVTTEGTDLVSLTDNASTPIEVSEGRIYQCTERGIYSSPLLGHEGDSYWVYESDDIINWVVDDGYLYVVEIKFAGDSVIRMIRRCSLEDGRIETLYTCTNTFIDGFAPYDGCIYIEEHVNGINQFISVDIETGQETTLFVSNPEDSDYSYREIAAWSVTSDGIFVVTYDSWIEEPFVLYKVAPDGSGATAVYTYDSAWAGDPLGSRNVGAHPCSELAYLFVCNGTAYFIPYSWEVENAYLTVDRDAPIYYSICAVDLDNGQFEVITTESTIIDM